MSPFYDPAIDPVLCSPYEPPDRHWKLDELGRAMRGVPPLSGRRAPLGISVPEDTKGQRAMHLGDRQKNRMVMGIREQVERWRSNGYEGATPTTKRLLWHWTDGQSMKLRPFYAQVEAMETFIWLREVAQRNKKERQDIESESRRLNDGINRLCAKMATGTGKTAVMGMLIAWQTLNAVRSTRTRNIQHTNRFAVLTPGLTVRDRLSVLHPSEEGNVYDEMDLVPHDLRKDLNRARIRIVNYQAFTQKELIDDAQVRRLLGQTNGENREAWVAAVRRVLGDIADGGAPICVINDEAHHCYLPKSKQYKTKKNNEDKAEDERAAVWFNVVREMRDQGLLGKFTKEWGQDCTVYDFSATPLWIEYAARSEPEQFQWVSSDFGLMDAIESGLVKVPRVPIDDDSSRDETIWRKLYANTNPKKLKSHFDAEGVGERKLPEHLNGAVDAVVGDWERRLESWMAPKEISGVPPQPTPPVIIFVANNIANATALWEYLAGTVDSDGSLKLGRFPELSNIYEDNSGIKRWHQQPRTLLVHSKIGGEDVIPNELKEMLVKQAGLSSKKDAEVAVRDMLNTVGKEGKPGEQIRCVVSVSMLTEGWDARTVTHIVGFRAFGTQLLCEQVTGRALRRTSYDAFCEPDADGRVVLEAEYADVVGIPFEFMPDVGEPETTPKIPKPRTNVYTVPKRGHLRVSWPQVVEYFWTAPQNHFTLDPEEVTKWNPGGSVVPTMAVTEGVVGASEILTSTDQESRDRTVLLRFAEQLVFSLVSTADNGDGEGLGRASLFRSALKAVKDWISHPNVNLSVEQLRNVMADPSHLKLAQHAILEACRDLEIDGRKRRAHLAKPPVIDTSRVEFQTTLQNILTDPEKSELSHAACHSQLELRTAEALEAHPRVVRWVRNFQLGWTIPYWRVGAWARYEPDFIAVLDDGTNLIIECKGVWDEKAKLAAEYTRTHWIPSVAGTFELPDSLRKWEYTVIEDKNTIRSDLDTAIREAKATLTKAA